MHLNQPFDSLSFARASMARRSHPMVARRRRRERTHSQASAAPASGAIAATVVPATLAALSTPAVQLNAAALLPRVEALLAGPFGPWALAVGCAVSAGAAAAARRQDRPRQEQIKPLALAAGQAGLGAPLIMGACRLAAGQALTANLLARGLVFGAVTLLGGLAGREAGRITGRNLPASLGSNPKIFSEAESRDRHEAREQAARQGSKLGGLAAGVIVGIAALRV